MPAFVFPDKPETNVVIAARSVLLSQALHTFLQAIPGVTLAAAVSDLDELAQKLGSLPAQTTVLLDADVLAGCFVPGIVELRSDFPYLSLVVLTNSLVQQESALRNGANFALLKGFLGLELHEALTGVRK